MEHWQRQKIQHDLVYKAGSRSHVTSDDPLLQYITRWRLKEGLRRLVMNANDRLNTDSSILVLCAGEGNEGSVLCDLGYRNVTVSDISDAGVAEAVNRDKRLRGLVLNAERADVPDNSFDILVVQDGLHHLQSPVGGFTEMLRIARTAVLFLEPHDAIIGRAIGTKWEKNGDAVNYVFRWTKRLVQDVASSYLGPDSFKNLSFSFCHHNPLFLKLGKTLGGGYFALSTIRFLKFILDSLLAKSGNQFCGLVVKRSD
jgi:ubiquinone/menaquinone biosynthesis C-methylase UbiE